ncbi:MAG: hypothetical protein ABI480_14895 [Chitinophagaceae bacterium]
MRYIRIIVLILSIVFFNGTSWAQTYIKKRDVEAANGLFALQVGFPSKAMQEAVKNKMGNLGFGLGICGLTNPFSWGHNKRNSPLRIGGEAGYSYYGRFLSEVNINGNSGSYKTSYGILQLNGIIQLRPAEPEVVTPFIELLAGGNFYLSTTKENLNAIESSLGVPSFDFGGYSSVGFNKGIAFGCTFGRKKEDEPRFTFRVSYNRGNSIKYVIRNSLAYNSSNGQLEYYVGRAPVRYFMAQVGVAF